MNDLKLGRTFPIYSRIRTGDILTEFYCGPGTRRRSTLMFCHGMPSHPFDRFPYGLERYLDEGFVLAYPHYAGTFGSGGLCTIENAVDSVLQSIDAITQGDLRDCFNGADITPIPKQIVLAGGSLGGSVALVAGAKSSSVAEIIAVAPPIDYRTHGRKRDVLEYDLALLQKQMTQGYADEWQFDDSFWRLFLDGEMDINPVDHSHTLKDKNTFLIHGDEDVAVSIETSVTLHNMFSGGRGKHRFLIVKSSPHLGAYCLADTGICTEVVSWLDSCGR